MTNKTYTFVLAILCLLGCPSIVISQVVSYTANDLVQPYNGYFHPSANIGEYTSFSQKTLAELAAGNPAIGIKGAGVKALRPGLFEDYLEGFGYDANVATFQFYKTLGMDDHTAIVGFPSAEHRDPTQYCPGIQSELFDNMYEPIWDGGANGTPINENNYYAFYMWKMVSTYKDDVHFWEIWNEPGFDYTGGLGFLQPGAPGNWWENNPNPCDYKLRAPIFHYVRLLRISWEVIKSIDPSAYVVVSGTGYPSFLDAILRNTDNPDDGSVSAEYPLGGGAYFDVMGFHSYPHFDGSLQEWNDQINDWDYFRHSDAAAQGLVKTKEVYQEVLSDYGYDGLAYPKKLWMVTEVNLPRKQFGDFIGSDLAQRNFTIKAVATAMMNEFLQLHFFKLAEDTYYDNASSEFDLMGLYKRLDYSDAYFQEMNESGIAHKTASDRLYGKTYDANRTAQLGLPATVDGGAFIDTAGRYTYVLWAKTNTDLSEQATATYSFPVSLGQDKLIQYNWDSGVTGVGTNIDINDITLDGTPRFFEETLFTLDQYVGCVPFELTANSQVAAANYAWTVTSSGNTVATADVQNPNFFFGAKGTYQVELEAFDGNGNLIASQVQTFQVNALPNPVFSVTTSGPIAFFDNESPFGEQNFLWEFGDGESSTDPVPTHVYLNTGTYTVSLTATNDCGSNTFNSTVEVISPSSTQIDYTANDSVPIFKGHFRPGISIDFVNGWTDEQLANLAAGNIMDDVPGAGIKSLRTYVGESFFLDLGYDAKKDLFDHYNNIDLKDNSFLLAFPSVESVDPYFYCPEQQSTIFKDLYLEIWDNGANGTPVNDENPWALYVYNTVLNYGPYVKYWEIYNSPDFDLTGDRGWLPPGEPGNWWENDPDPCDYELRAPIYYYIRTLRVAYEVIKYLDEEDYVTISGIAYPSFLDAICRNTDNPVNGSTSDPYPLKGGAYFDAVGYKSYPHFDGSTVYFDPAIGNFAFERHSDAAVSGIPRVKNEFQSVLDQYGYDGGSYPKKEFIISEANIPRRQLSFYLGGEEPQVNWSIKAWVESVRNNIRQLNFFRLAESNLSWLSTDAFEVMGFYQWMNGVLPYDQTINNQGIATKTCSDLLFAKDYSEQATAALLLPDSLDGGAFQDADGNLTYVLWAKTNTDLSEAVSAFYSFPADLNLNQLYLYKWDYAQTGNFEIIDPDDIELTGEPVFLSATFSSTTVPLAAFEADKDFGCEGEYIQFTSIASGNPQNWEWTFEGGIPAAHFGEIPPPILYQTSGKYSVSLKVSNAVGEHVFTANDLIEIGAAPTADFEVEFDGANVQFVNLSTNADSYEWCYGDGICNGIESPLYLYFENGDYTITLAATNTCGTSMHEETISIAVPPTADFITQYTGNCDIPQMILIDFSYSDPETWQWSIPGADPSTSDLRYPTINFPEGGYYDVTLVTSNLYGVDSITQSVYVEGHQETEIALTICTGDVYDGHPIYSDTTIVSNLTTTLLGCDSVVIAHISVADQVQSFQFVEVCEGDFIDGIEITQDTFFIDVLSSQAGCDSIVTTDVTVFPLGASSITEVLEFGDSIVIGSMVFNETGLYEIVLQTAEGCDSTISLDLTIATDLNETIKKQLAFKAYPVPFDHSLNLSFDLPASEKVNLSIYNVNGQLIKNLLSEEVLPMGQHLFTWDRTTLAPGMYLIKLQTSTAVVVQKVVGL